MPIPSVASGEVRGLFPANDPEGRTDGPVATNNRQDQLVAQSLPELTEIVRMGNTFTVITSSAATPVTAIPTTTALLSLWNGEPDGGKCYIIDSVFAIKVANDASASGMAILAMINQGAIRTAIANTLTPKGTMGQVYNGKGRVAVGTTVVNDGWYPVGVAPNSVPTATVSIGQAVDIPLRGLYIVPPSGQFNLSVLAAVATASSVQLGVRWHEAQIIWRP